MMTAERNRPIITVSITDGTLQRLDELAKEYVWSRSQVVDGLVRFYDVIQEHMRRYTVVTDQLTDETHELYWSDLYEGRFEVDALNEFADLRGRIGQGLLIQPYESEEQA